MNKGARSVVILDYGAGNLRSVEQALRRVAGADCSVLVSGDHEAVKAADRIVFPGQGAVGPCMRTLTGKGFAGLLRECIRNKPFLGICLGLQTLVDSSEEDASATGLGILPGQALRFPSDAKDETGQICKIPHMGWNTVRQSRPHRLWQGINAAEWFYFAHSYYTRLQRESDCAGTTSYIVDFAAAAARDNLFATQFHPEKSQRAGLTLLKNFLEWRP